MSLEPIIAQKPASPRDSSKLLIYNTKTDQVYIDKFYHLDKYLPEETFLILNKTKVIPSRIWLIKETGGKVEVLFLLNERQEKQEEIRIMVDRRVDIGDKLYFDKNNYIKVINQDEKYFTVKIFFPKVKLLAFLKKRGEMPIPKYIKGTPLTESDLRKKYQTIFAEKNGSIAAPTASLHFTNRVFNKLERKGINKYFLTLHVGLGTFAPVTQDNLRTRTLHREYYEIDPRLIKKIEQRKEAGGKLLAVGTTVVRALESVSKSKVFEATDLFILPPYHFKMVDCLLTNFHLPGTSLQMLVDAFLRFKKARRSLNDLYQLAIEKNFRFYSFGDAMLIL